MKITRSIVLTGFAALLVTGSLLFGCSKKSSNPTSPGDGGGGDTFNTGVINVVGFSFPHTFSTAGSMPYHCIPHSPGMAGTVIVSSSSTTDSVVVTVGPGGARTFDPSSVTVKVGGQVRWVWASVGHSVTSGAPTAAPMAMPDMPGMSGPGGR